MSATVMSLAEGPAALFRGLTFYLDPEMVVPPLGALRRAGWLWWRGLGRR